MASLPASKVTSLITSGSLQQAVGSMVPLGQISSVVQTLQNIQGFNPGQFSQLTNSIQSALKGFNTASNILSNFSGNSPVGAFLNTLQSTGMAGSTVASAAAAAGNAYRAADSFLGTAATINSFARLSSQRPGVEQSRNEAASNVPGGLRFPRDLGKYWIALNFVTATSSSIMSSNVPVKKKTSASVILPVPNNLIDQNSLEYTSFSVSGAALTGLAGAASILGAGLSGKIGSAAAAASQGGSDIISAAIATAGALTGEAMNTHQVLKFSQPSLKKHAFQWKLIPSTEQESVDIFNIINTIKKSIYPRAGDLTFDYPDLVEVFLCNAGQMYLFKPAYVETFSVTHNPDGQAFYRNGYPSAVTIDMAIQENAVWTSQDFGGGQSAEGKLYNQFGIRGR